MSDMPSLHASCVNMGGKGILIRGASGSGKSRLVHIALLRGALHGHPARLVADDRVLLDRSGDSLIARPPAVLAGLIELRGLGLARVDHLPQTPLHLVLDLLPIAEIPRLPPPEWQITHISGVTLPRWASPSPDSAFDALLTFLEHNQFRFTGGTAPCA
jgi:HPr kinase/phosphorylase